MEHDLELNFDQWRFKNVSVNDTTFPIAAPGVESHGRHTQNAVMLIDLKPEEVAQLDANVQSGQVSKEYSGGAWYEPADIAEPDSDFPDAVKQFIRDMHKEDLAEAALEEEAYKEKQLREENGGLTPAASRRLATKAATVDKLIELGLSDKEARDLEAIAGSQSPRAMVWTKEALTRTRAHNLAKLLGKLTKDDVGDYHRQKRLTSRGIKPPLTADNGPVLENILKASQLLLEYDQKHDGELLSKKH